MNQKSAFYNVITFVDIDGSDLPTDYECDRIPNKGEVITRIRNNELDKLI